MQNIIKNRVNTILTVSFPSGNAYRLTERIPIRIQRNPNVREFRFESDTGVSHYFQKRGNSMTIRAITINVSTWRKLSWFSPLQHTNAEQLPLEIFPEA
ncbi:hypothetical protein CEXT_668361 [Caerostris extrusa]|uniref:Uncharacterized protein n=1 Tax=Caerostris extrusa TaxID=172846 RepID=A0AAV4UB98_CAEEX|nr:hypothetical protein CEXT_668361 [Caerostris extrusa]